MKKPLQITALAPADRSGFCAVYVDDRLFVLAPVSAVMEFGFTEGERYTWADIACFGSAVNLYYTVQAAASAAARHPRSSDRLAEKLSERGFPGEAVQTAIMLGKWLGWIDDGLLAETVVRGRLNRRPQGEAMLLQSLRQRGFDLAAVRPVVKQVLQEFDLDRMALDALIRRYRTHTPSGNYKNIQRQKQKYFLFLHNRGFTGEIARYAVRRFMAETVEDE